MIDKKSTVTVHMVASLDGYIAKADHSVEWMLTSDHYVSGKELTDEDVQDFLSHIDCYVMGSKTYETALALGWPYGDKPVYVLTSRKLPIERDTVVLSNASLRELFEETLMLKFERIWIVGGAALTKSALKEGIIDEIVISFLPVLLGSGLHFFDEVGVEQKLHLKEHVAYNNGMVEMTYEILKG